MREGEKGRKEEGRSKGEGEAEGERRREEEKEKERGRRRDGDSTPSTSSQGDQEGKGFHFSCNVLAPKRPARTPQPISVKVEHHVVGLTNQ